MSTLGFLRVMVSPFDHFSLCLVVRVEGALLGVLKLFSISGELSPILADNLGTWRNGYSVGEDIGPSIHKYDLLACVLRNHTLKANSVIGHPIACSATF